MLNVVILMGRLVAAPELRQTPNGVSVCAFRIAVNRRYSKDGEQQADFIDIVTWRQCAEFVSRYFSKGRMIIVEGSIQTRNYEDKNGNKRTAVEVVANNVQFGESKSASQQNAGSGTPSSPQAPAAPAAPAVSYSSGEMGDFSDMPADSEDLPF